MRAWFNPERSMRMISDTRIRKAFAAFSFAHLDALRSCALSSGALAIKAGGSALAATASAVTVLVDGKLVAKAAADMAALSGTVANAAYNVFVFSLDGAGTAITEMGQEGATLAAVRFPPIPKGRAVLGFVIIHPTGTGDFVGGTTVLDDGTVVPNASYVNTPYPFNPNIEG